MNQRTSPRSSGNNSSLVGNLPELFVTSTPPFEEEECLTPSLALKKEDEGGRPSLSLGDPGVQLTSMIKTSSAQPSDLLSRGSIPPSSLVRQFQKGKSSSFKRYLHKYHSSIVEPVPTVSRIDSGAVFSSRTDADPVKLQYRPPSIAQTVQSSVYLLAEDPEESTKRTIILFVVLCILNALIGMAGEAAKSLGALDVRKTSQYVVTGFICVIAPVPWYGLGPMFKAMSAFSWKTHGMVTLCRFFYALNNIPTIYIIEYCGSPIYQLTKLINILPIHIAYRVLLGKTYSSSIWLAAFVIVYFSALFTDLDNIGESSGGTDIDLMRGLPWILGKILFRTFYTVLTDVLIKDVLPDDVDEVVKIQVFNFYDFLVCLVLAMVYWPDYHIVWEKSGWIFHNYSFGSFLVPMAEASYSFISLQVLAVLSGEALSISQGFALVILWCFNLVLNSATGKDLNVTFTTVFSILGVAFTIVLYGIAVEQNKLEAITDSVEVWHPMMDANLESGSQYPGGSVTEMGDYWEDSVFRSGNFHNESMLPKINLSGDPPEVQDSYGLSNQNKLVLAPANYVSPVPLPVPPLTSSFDGEPKDAIVGQKMAPEIIL